MVEGIGINPGVGHLAQHAHILPGVGGHQHRDLGMEKHALGHQRRFNGVRGGLLVQPAKLHFVRSWAASPCLPGKRARRNETPGCGTRKYRESLRGRWEPAWEIAESVPAKGGIPAWFAPAGLFHTAGASLGLGRAFVSCEKGMRATPVGRPSRLGVGRLGVGSCACPIAPARSTASSTTTVRVH